MRILITGANGWIGSELVRRLGKFPGRYSVNRVSVRGNAWENDDWSAYDSVVHLAADAYGENPEAANTELSRRVAEKCSRDGVSHVVLMSSFAVYGTEAIKKDVVVDGSTIPAPSNPYGRSKFASEAAMKAVLENSTSRLAIIRAPLVYGPGEKGGNFPKLVTLAKKAPIFPKTSNGRSMIYSQSLCELVRLLCDKQLAGIYLPQDYSYHDTSDLVRDLGAAQGKKVHIVPGAPLCHAAAGLNPKMGKLFGSDRYDLTASDCGLDYRVCSDAEAVRCSAIG